MPRLEFTSAIHADGSWCLKAGDQKSFERLRAILKRKFPQVSFEEVRIDFSTLALILDRKSQQSWQDHVKPYVHVLGAGKLCFMYLVRKEDKKIQLVPDAFYPEAGLM